MKATEAKTLESAADELVSLLSTEERVALANSLTINPLIKGGTEFIALAMRHFHLHDAVARSLLQHIHERSPGHVTNMDFVADTADPLLAARLIVERAREKILGSTR